MDTNITIVRALWGDTERSLNEVFPLPIFKEEIVYVWGIKNQELLEKRGFQTILMGTTVTDPNYSTIHTQYYHKLEVIRRANNDYSEFIFLDWDCYLLKLLDEYFYKSLKEGNDTQVPTYAYLDTKYAGIPKLVLSPGNERYRNSISEDLRNYILSQESQLRKYSWKKDGLLVSPNFCFFYTRRSNIGEELLQIAKEHQIENCVEEHAMYLWANCNIDEFIQKYEPKVVQGTADETRTSLYKYEYENDPVIRINKYISQSINKNIYFKHI